MFLRSWELLLLVSHNLLYILDFQIFGQWNVNLLHVLELCIDILTWYLGSQATYICFLTRLFAEPESFKNQLQSDTNAAAGRGRLSVSEESRAYESKRLTVSSSHLDRTEARISSSAHESRCQLLVHIYIVPLFCYSVIFLSLITTPFVSQQERSHWQEFLPTYICC